MANEAIIILALHVRLQTTRNSVKYTFMLFDVVINNKTIYDSIYQM